MSSHESSSDRSQGPSRDEGPEERPRCPWQTERYHSTECSRFLDCPQHVFPRHLVGGESSEDERGMEYWLEEPGEGEQVLRDETPAASQSTAEDSSGPSRHGRQPSYNARGKEVVNSTSLPPSGGEYQAAVAGPSSAAGGSRLRQVETIDLTPDSHTEDETPGALPRGTLAGPASGSSATPSGRASSSSNRRPGTPPSPPPPFRMRTSTNDVWASNRVARPQPQSRPSRDRTPSDFVLPRWQPDAEVTYCPICQTQFSIFNRKHHCRKCGRVVCGSCSPHRITIPYQYIVQPPGTPRPETQLYPSSLISGEGGYGDFSSLGGGQKVRLCNPCVPDPNTNPHHAQDPSSAGFGGHGRSQSTASVGSGYDAGPSASHFATRQDAYGRNRSATMAPSGSRQPSGGYPQQRPHNRILSGTPPAHWPFAAPGEFGPQHPRASWAASMSALARRPLPPAPQPLAEEDECPVCHRELPSRSLANFEALRDAHINGCIAAHSTYQENAPVGGGGGGGEGPSAGRPRRTGMLRYTATEKDCVDSAECTICLEEFEAGVAMARLECLCRFHHDCIRRWFAKNPGKCPVHAHDGHGF